MAIAAKTRCLNCGKLNRVPVAAEGVPRCAVCKAKLPWIVDADSTDFDAAINATIPAVIDFWAEWCGPCRMVSPLVEKLGRDYAGRLKVVKVDTDGAPDVAARYQVMGIPLLVFVRDGEEVDRFVGAPPEPQLRAWLQPLLDAEDSAGDPVAETRGSR
jgi:thioredoxin 2